MHLNNTFKKELTTCLKQKVLKMDAKFYFAVISTENVQKINGSFPMVVVCR